MRNEQHPSCRRIELGQVSLVTKGNVFGTIEQVGLYQPRSSLAAR